MRIKNKKALSEVMGYVLLISFAMIMGGIVYYWIKSYVPSDELKCPDDVSIFIEDYTCNLPTLTLTIKNNGKFNIEGYFIRGATDVGQEVATTDLSKYEKNGYGISGVVRFITGVLKIGYEETTEFNLASSNINTLYLIEIIPVRTEVIDNKNKLATCTEAKVKQNIICQ